MADTIVQDLTVGDGHATGTINDLAEGCWHVTVDVYSGATKIFTGEQDVNVIAGLVVNATIWRRTIPGTTAATILGALSG